MNQSVDGQLNWPNLLGGLALLLLLLLLLLQCKLIQGRVFRRVGIKRN